MGWGGGKETKVVAVVGWGWGWGGGGGGAGGGAPGVLWCVVLLLGVGAWGCMV